MEIKFQGSYKKEEFFKGVRLANQLEGNQNRFIWFLFFFVLGTTVVLIYRAQVSGQWSENAILIGAGTLLAGVIVGLMLRPNLTARRMWQESGTRRRLKGRITNQSLIYEFDLGRNEISWNRIKRIKKDEDLVSLVREDGLLLIFPRHFFGRDADWRKFVKFITTMTQAR